MRRVPLKNNNRKPKSRHWGNGTVGREMCGNGLTPAQTRAAIMFAGGGKHGDIAKDLNLSKTRLSMWKAEKPFKKYVGQLLEQLHNDLRHEAQAAVRESLDTLRDAVRTGGKKGSRFSAKDAVMSARTVMGIYVVHAIREGIPSDQYTPDESFL